MPMVDEHRTSLLLAAQRGQAAELAAGAEELAAAWHATLGAGTTVRVMVRQAGDGLAGTHFEALVPDHRPFDVAVCAWSAAAAGSADAPTAPEVAGRLDGLVDTDRSQVLAGPQLRFFRDKGKPVVLAFLLGRRDSMDHEAFVDYWRNQHTTLSFPRLGGYAQFYVDRAATEAAASRSGLPAGSFDGLSEPAYEDDEHFRRVTLDPAVREVAAGDERNFLDHARCAVALCRQTWSERPAP